MPGTLEHLIQRVASRDIPPVILVGGNNEFLVEEAFHRIRQEILKSGSGVQLETFPETADLAEVLDSYRTHTLFGGSRLLVLPEVNAFVTAKELAALLAKALGDWRSAKTDKKRDSALAKLLHTLGLVGLDLEARDREIVEVLGVDSSDEPPLLEMLASARERGRKVTRGEGDASLLAEAIGAGGAPGTILLMRSGEIPSNSATVAAIEKAGVVVFLHLSRDNFTSALDSAIKAISDDYGVAFERGAVPALSAQLGIDRVLEDKRSRDIPDLRTAVTEATRLAAYVGRGGRVSARIVGEQVASVEGGQRYEFASLVSEGKIVEAVAKLRDLVTQARREDPKASTDFLYGRYLFSLADEIRQILGVISFCSARQIDPERIPPYNQFKDTLATPMGEYLVQNGLARQRMHPFVLYKKLEAARRYGEMALLEALESIASAEFARKSGGASAEVQIETTVLRLGARGFRA